MTDLMIEAGLRALLFAIVVGAGLRLLRVKNVPVRKAAWSVVLIASLAMPFLIRWPTVTNWSARWGWAVPIPLGRSTANPMHAEYTPTKLVALPPAAQTAPARDRAPNTTPADTIVPPPVAISAARDDSAESKPVAATEESNRVLLHWPPADRLIVMGYLAVACVLLLRLLWGLAMALRLWISADLVSPLMAPEPNVRSSAKILSPVTIGSGIVLPADYAAWDRKKLRMVLAHERSHVRQMDFYLQLLAGLYTVVFWFSPLGWWLRRTLAFLGEAIGDRAGLDAAASRSRYAEVLLEFAAMPRRTLPGVAMARPGNLSHRVERFLNEPLFRSAFAEGRRRGLVSLLLIPAALFAATALVRVPSAGAQTAPAPPSPPTVPNPAPAPVAAPSVPAAPAMAPAPPDAAVQNPVAPAPAPIPVAPSSADAPAAPAPVIAPPASAAPAASAPRDPDGVRSDDSDTDNDQTASDYSQDAKGYSYLFSSNGESYAIVEGPGNEVTFSGDWNGDRQAEIDAARKVAKGPFLWFTHEGKSYIVTDPAIIARIRAMYKPMAELGHRQALLGQQQEAFGKQMEELARAQEAAGQVRMPDLSKETAEMDAAMARMKEEQDHWNTKEMVEAEAKLKAARDKMLTPEKIAEMQANLAAAQAKMNSETMAAMEAKLGELQARLGELQGEAGARQGAFGSKMGALGAEQGKLGAEQGRLGAEQGRLAHQANGQVRSIIEECLRNGKATQVPQVK